jgi:hypothetical protein
VFGDSIVSLTDMPGGVHVTFERSAPRTFDLVVGADGIYSTVRRLAFGPEDDYVTHLGHYHALADLGVSGDGVMDNEPGRMAAIGGPKAPAFFVFAAPKLDYDRFDVEQQKELLAEAYRGVGWRVPELLAEPGGGRSLYPGASQPQWVRITNPNHFDILVTSLSATAGSRATGCPAGNLTVVPLRTPVRVRATSYTDTALTARLSPTAPDGCKNLTFPLTYSGTATKP